jgi:RNA polymerase sigma-70 factor, ECF subfamily
MPTHLDNEDVLVAEARAGNAESFATLINQYDRHIYRLALNMTGNQEDAEDVLQDSFLKAYSHLGQFQGDSRFYTWLVRIAVNEALMKLRKRRGASWVSLDEPAETDDRSLMPREIEDWADNPEQSYAKTELQGILTQAIEKLEPQFRTVFVLRDLEEFSTEETAKMLGLSVPAVKSRLLRARLKLREWLNKYFKRGPR